ncbi:2-phospho-L-lactate guanylyltransferase [Halobellus sp. Atlit-31R]|nr:2-phospho-L-lactate guanylyltransferase [Halobellus sp. Atlit-31R]
MRVLVPYTAQNPKSRLDPPLSLTERQSFSLAMLCDVVDAICDAGHTPELLLSTPLDEDADGVDDRLADLPRTVDDRSLTAAVNAGLDRIGREEPELAVVMADLALATPTALQRLFAVGGDVAIAPGRGGGTNALVVRDPAFGVDYHGASYRDHRRLAETAGLAVGTVDSMRLATDVDEPTDLAEVLLHGRGRAAEWLRDAGFAVAVDGGRVGIDRS